MERYNTAYLLLLFSIQSCLNYSYQNVGLKLTIV